MTCKNRYGYHFTQWGAKNAYYTDRVSFTLGVGEFGNSTRVNVENGILLMSYNSIVAAFDLDAGIIYELPRAHYSVTTARQVTQFINHLCNYEGFKDNMDGRVLVDGMIVKGYGNSEYVVEW